MNQLLGWLGEHRRAAGLRGRSWLLARRLANSGLFLSAHLCLQQVRKAEKAHFY